MSYKPIKFHEMYEDLMEHQKNIKEAIDANKIIDELIDTSFGGSNETQMKAVQLLKGLATSDDAASNAFMKKLDAWTSGLKKSESIKSDLDALDLGIDDTKRSGKLITLTWKVAQGVSADEIAKRLKSGLSKHSDKIKHIGAEKSGAGIKAEIEMK